MKAALYIRVSTQEQAINGVSLAAQEEKLLAYCQLSGMGPAAVIREEGVSGSRPLATRPGGAELLKLVARKEIEHVVTMKLDRLFRDAADALNQTKAWDKAGVALHLVDMGGQTLNTASPMGRFFLSMTASFAELERNLIAERTSTALNHKKSHKQAYSPTPFGYDRTGNSLAENPQEQEAVVKIMGWRRAGWSLRRIVGELNRLAIPTKRGGQWHPCTVRYLLKNDLYAEA